MDRQADDRPTGGGNSGTRGPVWDTGFWILAALLAAVSLSYFFWPKSSEISFSFLVTQIKADNVTKITLRKEVAMGTFKEAPTAPAKVDSGGKEAVPTDMRGNPLKLSKSFYVVLPFVEKQLGDLTTLLEEHGVQQEVQASDNSFWFMVLISVITLGMLGFVVLSMRRIREQMTGAGFLSGFTRSPAKRYEPERRPVTFNDVAGLDGVKADLQEIVDFLKSPEKFQKLGGRVPKGVLLNGPPGSGKTLLARAVAGEAGVPFYSVNGSEFIQMFVGVGASRVRDLFSTAKQHSPAIIFIDEIDAVGRQRGAGLGGGHDEREQTLNQILSEMDGFVQTDTIIVLAATNRPDVLDPALLRPGRFDRHVTVGRPTLKGRMEIFKVHVRDVPLDDDVDLHRLAASTVGLTGADIRNLVNEAALWAARQNKSRVTMNDFNVARDKVLMGAKREEVLQEREKEKTAYHEAGHTLTAWHLPGANRVHKVTIIPRGRALGVTQMMPTEERLNVSETELRDNLIVLLGGRAAESLVYQEVTVGAENDLERATGLARRMVTHWGMSERLGPVSYKMSDDDPFLGRELHQQRQFSEHTMELIDEEVTRILHKASHDARQLLEQRRSQLEAIAQALVEREELDEAEIEQLIGPSVHPPMENGKPAAPATPTTPTTTTPRPEPRLSPAAAE